MLRNLFLYFCKLYGGCWVSCGSGDGGGILRIFLKLVVCITTNGVWDYRIVWSMLTWEKLITIYVLCLLVKGSTDLFYISYDTLVSL